MPVDVGHAAVADCSATITTRGQAVTLLTAGQTAHGALVQNIDSLEAVWFSLTGTAVAGGVGFVHPAAVAGEGLRHLLHVSDQSSDRRRIWPFGRRRDAWGIRSHAHGGEMTGLSSAGEAAVLTPLTTTAYVSLHTADPGNTGASEVSGSPTRE